MFLAGLSFVIVALIQMRLDAGPQPSVLWQLAPYVALTLGEVLVSVTGLEFAYSQAPPSMKGTIQSFWLLTTFAGNLVVAVMARLNVFTGASALLFYAGAGRGRRAWPGAGRPPPRRPPVFPPRRESAARSPDL